MNNRFKTHHPFTPNASSVSCQRIICLSETDDAFLDNAKNVRNKSIKRAKYLKVVNKK